MRRPERHTLQKVIAALLLLSLLLSVVYCVIRLVTVPDSRSDYLLMLVQCLLGLVVMLLPSILTHRFRIPIPSRMSILYYIFLFCGIVLGEVFRFYFVFPEWDTFLHFFSGGMLTAVGFMLADLLNRDEHIRFSLSPAFVSIFAFCFALAAGAIWEIHEYNCDVLLGLNMQKHTDASGTPLVGRYALDDTMQDIKVDARAACLVATLGYLMNPARRAIKSAEDIKE